MLWSMRWRAWHSGCRRQVSVLGWLAGWLAASGCYALKHEVEVAAGLGGLAQRQRARVGAEGGGWCGGAEGGGRCGGAVGGAVPFGQKCQLTLD